MKQVAEKLEEATSKEGYESYDQVSFVLAFVQSLPYTSDSVTSGFDEYPRFPLEPLVDNGGDCEDTSILFATLTILMGYGTVFINPPNHCAVGVLGDDLAGYYYTLNDKTYYYCETTGDGWEIGEMPDEYKNIESIIYEIKQYQQYDPYSSNYDSGENDSSTFNAIIGGVILFAFIVAIIVASRKKSLNQAQSKSPPPEIKSVNNQTDYLPKYSRYCRYCGSKNAEYAIFCEKCGRNIT